MKIKLLLPGIYIATNDDGTKRLGRIALRRHENAELPWYAQKQGFIGSSQKWLRTLNEARDWIRR